MRIHGDFIVKRRVEITQQADYHNYQNNLSEDFGRLCGYCGKTEKTTFKGFEIDHLVPVSIAPERKIDYANLVYCCFTCNRKKAKKWPTLNKHICHNEKVGFIDPASEEFDLHLERTLTGDIIGLTNVGKYMCNIGFKFPVRPIKEIWLCTQILNKQAILEKKIETMTPEENKEYIFINQELKELYNLLFKKKE